jgi:hypothetical protein
VERLHAILHDEIQVEDIPPRRAAGGRGAQEAAVESR